MYGVDAIADKHSWKACCLCHMRKLFCCILVRPVPNSLWVIFDLCDGHPIVIVQLREMMSVLGGGAH